MAAGLGGDCSADAACGEGLQHHPIEQSWAVAVAMILWLSCCLGSRRCCLLVVKAVVLVVSAAKQCDLSAHDRYLKRMSERKTNKKKPTSITNVSPTQHVHVSTDSTS